MDMLLSEVVNTLKGRWSDNSRVDQHRRRLQQLVDKVHAVTKASECRGGDGARDLSFYRWINGLRAAALRGQEVLEAEGCDATAAAGSARKFFAGLWALFCPSAEVGRLTDAVEELEKLAGPGGDLDLVLKMIQLDPSPRTTEMEVDGGEEGSSCSAGSITSPRSTLMEVDGGAWDRVGEGRGGSAHPVPAPGAKRKHAASASSFSANGGSASLGQVDNDTVQLRKSQGTRDRVEEGRGSSADLVPVLGAKRKRSASSSGADGGSASLGEVDNDALQTQKRQVLVWKRPHEWALVCFNPPPPVSRSHRARAQAVARAMSRVRQRMGKPGRRRQHQRLVRGLSRMSLCDVCNWCSTNIQWYREGWPYSGIEKVGHNGFPVIDEPPFSDSPKLYGLIPRDHLLVLLRKKDFARSCTASTLNTSKHFTHDEFAKRGSGKQDRIEDIELSAEELEMFVHLHPFTNTSYTFP